MVNLERMLAVGVIDDGERVELHLVLLQESQPLHDLVERGLLALVDTVTVVQLARAVDAQADPEAEMGRTG